MGIFTGIRVTEAQREQRCTSVRSVDDLILDPGSIDSFWTVTALLQLSTASGGIVTTEMLTIQVMTQWSG